jgi:UDP-GlcNAc:undecaprenyl-phosphate/decaprenyl-phosphate GlcNAc-1-phosphate transferase
VEERVAELIGVLLIGLALQPVVLRVLTSAAIVDVPNDRSSHTVATPRGGGVAVVLAAAIGLLALPEARLWLVPLLACAAIGLVDDIRGTPVATRLAAQAVVGLATGLLIARSAALPLLVVLLIGAWCLAFVNAFNFMDGINGIAALTATLAGLVYAGLGVADGLPGLAGAGAVIAAAASTFLPWNLLRARMFLGDVGSYGLGAAIATLAAYAVAHGVPADAAAGPVALYLADTGWTLARRIARGEPWHRPHRMHVYQRMVDCGLSHSSVAASVVALEALVCICTFAASRLGPLPRLGLDAIALAVLVAYLAAPKLLSRILADRQTGVGAYA